MTLENLLQHLRALEIALHQPDVRSDAERLGALLHDSFVEIGRSGQIHSREDILRDLPTEKPSSTVWSQDFSVAEIGDGVALLTYKSAHVDAKGEFSRYTLRASLWQRTAQGWQMRFYQGTPTGEFKS
ncbi:hypothetical protein MNBD_CHLOROFLEXI01-3354 [hydrothermal vent metagenome]|uniref:DUF4440 domain-containing protein n=1 Tax=hydrothermal vent metagenome TaxID=652676 RepID=A0A3B0W1G0_9ZZZZ